MEGAYSNNNSRVSKINVFKGNVSPLNTQRDNNNNNNHQLFSFHYTSNSPIFDPYASPLDKSNLENLSPSTLIRYLRSVSPASPEDAFKTPSVMIGHQQYFNGNSNGGSGGFGSSSSSPLRAVENLETPPSRSPPVVFKTPVKVEEDVLVMDGILVGGSGSGGRMRLSALSDSGGLSSPGSNSAHKRELCRSWEDNSLCRHGSKCQFAHGKEEVRPSQFPASKKKSEIYKSYSGSGSCSYAAKCRFSHHQAIIASPPTERALVTMKGAKTQSISPIKPENSNDSSSSTCGSKTTDTTTATSTTITNTDWSPIDDGIVVTLPSSASADEIPTREAVDAYINSVLYGPPRGKRLPVFAEICPE